MRNSLCLIFLILFIAACKKNKDQVQAPVKTDWSAILKNSVWTGEIQYTQSVILIPQYCSIVFGNDNTFSMTDSRQIHNGTWSVVDSTITLDLSGPKKIADLGKERWKNFQSSSTSEFNFLSVTKSTAVDATAMPGTVWKGTFYGKNLQLEFLAGKNVKITHPDVNAGTPTTVSYITYGSGISFSSPFTGAPLGVSYFGSFTNTNNTEFSGISYNVGATFLFYWKVTKQ